MAKHTFSFYDLMAKDGLEVDIYKIDHFFHGEHLKTMKSLYIVNEIRSFTSQTNRFKDINLVLPISW